MTKDRSDFLNALLEGLKDSKLTPDDAILPGLSLVPIEPAAKVRERLLFAASKPGRLDDFAHSVAKQLDIPQVAASQLLTSLDDSSVWTAPGIPGAEFCWVEGGACVKNAVRGFVRVKAGSFFPEHEHVGPERVLVIQGSLIDSVTEESSCPGDLLERPSGSSHGFSVPAGGPDLLILSVIHEGVRVGKSLMLPQ